MNTNKVNRLEIIDHRPCEECEGTGQVAVPRKKENSEPKQQQCISCSGSGMSGRTVVVHSKAVNISTSLQDNDQTLKVFIEDK